MSPPVLIRTATPGDIPLAARTITSAFERDPVWGWALEGAPASAAAAWWSVALTSALRYPWLRVTGACESVALWVPPGGTELTPEEEEGLEPVFDAFATERGALFPEIMRRFEASHPHQEPHFYLSLWGTHEEHRGTGLGGALIRASLTEIDAAHLPAYLESTNDANLERYAKLGFERHGAFSLPAGGPTVTTMWRPAR